MAKLKEYEGTWQETHDIEGHNIYTFNTLNGLKSKSTGTPVININTDCGKVKAAFFQPSR